MTGNLTLNSEELPITEPISSSLVDLRFFLVRIFYPCLLIWGTIGNALCLRVLLSKKFFKNSTCQYLAILAVIDILFILMRSSKHIYKLFRDTPIFNTSQSICRILTFFSSALAHMASWILVIVSFDRYLIVTSRYQRQSSAANRVFWSTSIMIAIVVLCNLYYFLILGQTIDMGNYPSHNQQHLLSSNTINTNDTSLEIIEIDEYFQSKPMKIFMCIPSKGFEQFFRTYIPIFDILLVAVIPFFLLCFTNIGIITYTMRTNRRMHQHRKRAHRRHQRLTIMLLSVTLAFIGLTCPSVIFICVNKIIYSMRLQTDKKPVNSNESSNVQLIVDVCEALWYTKHSMNFILYTLSGQDFRREFIKLFTQCFQTRPSISPPGRAVNSSLIEIPIANNSNHRKKFKKAIPNDHNIPSNVSLTTKTATALTIAHSI